MSRPAYRASTVKAKPAVYRASTLKRMRRSADQIAQLDRQIIDVLKADHPQSVRHVFYRMTDPRLPHSVEKSDKGYRHVQERCVKLRRGGRIPYQWIADMSRRGYFVNTFDGAGDFVARMSGLYRADLWTNAAYRCEVWAESRSIASVIQADCEELAVSLYPCGGFSSLSFIHEAAEQTNQADDDRPLVIFYVGDYDPAGVLIDESLQREMRAHLRDDIELQFHRIGINEEQIATYDLPTKPRKAGDRRATHILHTVEAEAMPARVLRALLRERIEALLPAHALNVSRIAEHSERAHLERVVDLLSAGAV